MPGLPDCDRCELRDDPAVTCICLEFNRPIFCHLPSAARRNTLERMGLWVEPEPSPKPVPKSPEDCGTCPDPAPTLAVRVANYATSTARHARDGFRAARPEVRSARLELCRACPKLTAAGRCGPCGCPVEKKAARRSESCPIGRWRD